MAIFIIIAGGLALFHAFTGKAPGFNTDYPKEIKADADKMLRKFCYILGPLAIASGITQMIPELEWTYWIGIIVVLVVVIIYIVMFRIKFGKYLKKK